MKAITTCRYAAPTFAILALTVPRISAQNEQVQQRVTALNEAATANQHALARYTWQEVQTVTINGDVKKTETFRVRVLPDGTQEKTPIDPATTAESGGRKRGIKHKIVEKRTEEYEAYAKKLAALGHLYAHPDGTRLQTAFEAGKVSVGPSGNPDETRLVIQDYAKTGDTVTISFDQVQRAMMSVQIQSYLDVPDDKATIVVKYARIPAGPSYPQNIGIEGVNKQLAVGIVNSDYKKIQAP